jgi:hypothetical protein
MYVPAVIAKANLQQVPFAMTWQWDDTTPPWSTDGSRSPIVKKLEAMSVRGTLAMLAASAEWFFARLGVRNDAMLAALWSQVETENPVPLEEGSFDLAAPEPAARFLTQFEYSARRGISVAHKFDGAVFSRVEGAMRFTQFVMHAPKPYATWRRNQYASLANSAGDYTMRDVYQRIVAQAKESGLPHYTITKQLRSTAGITALWGPPLRRSDVFER